MDWIGLAQDRDRWRTLVSAVMSLRVPWNAGNFLTSFSRRTLHHGVSSVEIEHYKSCTSGLQHSFLACAEITSKLPCMVIRVTNRTADYEQNGHHSCYLSKPTYLDRDVNWSCLLTYAVSVVQEVHLSTNRWLIQPHTVMFERVACGGESRLRKLFGMWRSVAE